MASKQSVPKKVVKPVPAAPPKTGGVKPPVAAPPRKPIKPTGGSLADRGNAVSTSEAVRAVQYPGIGLLESGKYRTMKALERETLDKVRQAKGKLSFLFKKPFEQDGVTPTSLPFFGGIDPRSLFYQPDYNSRYVDRSYETEDGTIGIGSYLFGSLPSILQGTTPTWNPLGILSLVARLAGNDDASRTLFDFAFGAGQPQNVPVDRMLLELPRFSREVLKMNQTSLVGLVSGEGELTADANFVIYRSVAGIRVNKDINGDGYNEQIWSRVGQQSSEASERDPRAQSQLTDLYAVGGISTDPQSDDFQYMYNGASTPSRYTREEFDWYIAMNAFDYTISQVVVVDQRTGDAILYYQVNVADEYAWYVNPATGTVDKIMAQLDVAGLGEPYELRGTSSTFSVSFNVNDIRTDDQSGSVTGTPNEQYYDLLPSGN